MSVLLNHTHIRNFAKALRKQTGDTVRHSEIITDIAAALGMKPDAMMHFLKSSGKTLEITDRFIFTLSRRLSARPVKDVTLVSTWGVLLALAIATKRSPTDVGNDLGGQYRAGPGRAIVYDEFELVTRPKPAEVLRTWNPLFYLSEETIKRFGIPASAQKLSEVGNGWYKVER
jgi:hypothetical protein